MIQAARFVNPYSEETFYLNYYTKLRWTQTSEAAGHPECESFAEVDQHLLYWTKLFNMPTERILRWGLCNLEEVYSTFP